MSITLPPRLQAVARWVPSGCRFADIGTDHAYLPAFLLQEKILSHAIAADLRQGPLARARATAARYGLTSAMDFRLSDGLQALMPGEADCIAIAGMGGETIRAILEAAPWTRERQVRLLLQPQTNLPELRRWLTGSGYAIHADCCVREENRWYTVLWVTGGTDSTAWTPASLLAGHPSQWEACACREAHLRFLLERTQRQIEGLRHAQTPDPERLDWLCRAQDELTQWLDHET